MKMYNNRTDHYHHCYITFTQQHQSFVSQDFLIKKKQHLSFFLEDVDVQMCACVGKKLAKIELP